MVNWPPTCELLNQCQDFDSETSRKKTQYAQALEHAAFEVIQRFLKSGYSG